jgi:hypothetical protein
LLLILQLSSTEAVSSETRAPEQQEYSDPEITVELDEEVFLTRAEPYPNNEAMITGKITCIIPDYVPESVFVEIIISLFGVDMDYDGVDEFFVTKDEPAVSISLTFYPVHDAKANDRFDFEFRTLWEYSQIGAGSGQAESVYGSVLVTPFGQVYLNPINPNPTFDVTIGEPYSYTMDLRNQGNSECTIEIIVTGSPPGVEVTVLPASIKMQPFNTKLIEISIYQKEGDPQEETITLKVRSDAPGELAAQEYSYLYSSSEEKKLDPQTLLTLMITGGFGLVFFIVMVVFILFLRKGMKKVNGPDEQNGQYDREITIGEIEL